MVHVDIEQAIIYMELEGNKAKVLEITNLKLYPKYIVMGNGKSVIYVRLDRAIYVTIYAFLSFWGNIMNISLVWRFKINTQDCCVLNKIKNGKQIISM